MIACDRKRQDILTISITIEIVSKKKEFSKLKKYVPWIILKKETY